MNWSLHRYTDLICLVITALTVGLVVVFMSGARWGLQTVTTDGVADRDGIFSARDYQDTWDADSAIAIDLDYLDKLGHNAGAYALTGDLHIVQGGTYVLSGSLSEHQVIVDASTTKVQLVLDGVTLAHSTLSPMVVTAADKVFLTLPENSRNQITAGNLISPEASNAGTDAAVYSHADLAINGSGSLEVQAAGGHGIKSTDDLVITGGQIQVEADKTALLGKDSVRIAAGSFTLSGGDGIKANQTEREDKGYITIVDGDFVIDVEGDAIQAETDLSISGGNFQITTGGGAVNAAAHVESFGGPGGGRPAGAMGTGGQPPEGIGPRPEDSGEQALPGDWEQLAQNLSGDTAWQPPEPPEGFDLGNMGVQPDFTQKDHNMSTKTGNPDALAQTTTETTDDPSRKGLKAGRAIVIAGGAFTIDAQEDALHSDGTLTIEAGNFTIQAGDDAIHADGALTLSGGDVQIAACYEGVEGNPIVVRGGTIDLVAQDDGFNANGVSGQLGPWGGEPAGDDLASLQIVGGHIHLDVAGDGLDSNGDLIIGGGEIYIDGPSSAGNGALDSGTESGGVLAVHGGTILALGSSGMLETFAAESTQCSLAVTFPSSYQAGETLTIADSSGDEIISYELRKTGDAVVFSSPQLSLGETYIVSAGAQTQTITQDSISVGQTRSFGGGGQRGPGGGGRGMRPIDQPVESDNI